MHFCSPGMHNLRQYVFNNITVQNLNMSDLTLENIVFCVLESSILNLEPAWDFGHIFRVQPIKGKM